MIILRSLWSGFVGAPGFTNLAFDTPTPAAPTPQDVATARTALKAFWDACANHLAPEVAIQVLAEARHIDPANGALLGLVSDPAALNPTPGNGASSNYVGSAGGLVTLNTGSVVAGRSVKGRIFLVPMPTNDYVAGAINAAVVTAFQNAGAGLILQSGASGVPLGVYARHTVAHVNKKGVAVPGHLGAFALVTAATVTSKTASLRSRRD